MTNSEKKKMNSREPGTKIFTDADQEKMDLRIASLRASIEADKKAKEASKLLKKWSKK